MKVNVFNLIVLDESGSMQSITADASGMQSMLKEERHYRARFYDRISQSEDESLPQSGFFEDEVKPEKGK
jgi:hypothetical protein